MGRHKLQLKKQVQPIPRKRSNPSLLSWSSLGFCLRIAWNMYTKDSEKWDHLPATAGQASFLPISLQKSRPVLLQTRLLDGLYSRYQKVVWSSPSATFDLKCHSMKHHSTDPAHPSRKTKPLVSTFFRTSQHREAFHSINHFWAKNSGKILHTKDQGEKEDAKNFDSEPGPLPTFRSDICTRLALVKRSVKRGYNCIQSSFCRCKVIQ